MVASPDVTRAMVDTEMSTLLAWAALRGWTCEWDSAALVLKVSMVSPIDREKFVFELILDDFPAKPPMIEAVHPISGERGTPRCYPRGGRGYFHNSPCICAPWSRKAYGSQGGPHSDWEMRLWAQARPNHSKLVDILVLLDELLSDKSSYGGRMAP